MKNVLYWIAASCYFTFSPLQAQVISRGASEIKGTLVRVTGPLKNFRADRSPIKNIPVRDENGLINNHKQPRDNKIYAEQNLQAADPALQTTYPSSGSTNAATAGPSFNGMGYTSVNPPDPSLCAGPRHIIQMINGASGAYLKIFDKNGGQLLAQTYLDAITTKGGLGDPIALYDQLADRFILMEFANKSETTQEGLVIAVSKTNDPTGGWNVYFFGYGSTFPDYPKLSVWNDAYYGTTNDFANASSYSGSSVWAFERSAMLSGKTSASAQRITAGSSSVHFSMCPVTLQGTTAPPAGSGGLIAYMFDDAWTSTTSDQDNIGLFEFKVDFANAANSSLTTKTTLNTSAFKSDLCTATRGRCISQPGSSVALEGLEQRVMNQPVYRNFGSYEGIVMTHIVDKGSGISGIRWYELQKSSGSWSLYQQSTYSPNDAHRWLPSIAYDMFGNIGLGYNVSSSSLGVYPSVRFTGRKQCDPLNTMSYPETVMVSGTASNGSNRYGDYNHLVADPDGTTFWLTAEWNGGSSWSTRIGSFQLEQCPSPNCPNPSGLATSSIGNNTATLSWSSVTGADNFDIYYKLSTSSTWTLAVNGNTSRTVNLTGLTQLSSYDWQVRANCPAGNGNYVKASFITSGPCAAPSGLSTSALTVNSVILNWNAVQGASNYNVEYKLSTASTWISATVTTNYLSVSSLQPNTAYSWRVAANCTGSSSSAATASFTTPNYCNSNLDNTNNDATTGAAVIPFGTDVKGLINTTTDKDYYKFTITTGGTISLGLTTLPFDYDLRLYRGKNQVAISQNAGTANEGINYTARADTYYAQVYGYSGANSVTQCYTLRLNLGTAKAPEIAAAISSASTIKDGYSIKVYPNPVDQLLEVAFSGIAGPVGIRIVDLSGRVLQQKTAATGLAELNLGSLKSGIYLVKVINMKGDILHYSKFIKQ